MAKFAQMPTGFVIQLPLTGLTPVSPVRAGETYTSGRAIRWASAALRGERPEATSAALHADSRGMGKQQGHIHRHQVLRVGTIDATGRQLERPRLVIPALMPVESASKESTSLRVFPAREMLQS
jgi:hypothetical protein